MDRTAYLVRRLLLAIPTFVGITIVCFSLTRFLPGGPVEMRLMRMRGIAAAGGDSASAAASPSAASDVSAEHRRQIEKQFGFDKSLFRQYWDWLVVNRMGMKLPSYDYPDKTAWQLIRSRFPVSLWFGLAAFVLTYLVCVPLGIAKALRNGASAPSSVRVPSGKITTLRPDLSAAASVCSDRRMSPFMSIVMMLCRCAKPAMRPPTCLAVA